MFVHAQQVIEYGRPSFGDDMRSDLRRLAAGIISRGTFSEMESEILAAFEQADGAADQIRLESVVRSAMSNVPYYRELKNVSSFEDLPVVDKVTIRARPQDFLREEIDRSRLKSRSTSGSTGIPFQVFMEAARALRNQAAAAAAYKYAGGDPFAPMVQAKAWARLSRRQNLAHWLKEYYAYNADHFRTSDALRVGAWIRKRRNAVLQGYPSYLEKAFRVFEEQDISFEKGTVSAVVSTAEAPTKYFFESAYRLFGVAAHSLYSNMEMGVISISARANYGTYKVDTSSFHVEILKEDSDYPAEDGELGRIVVTDLHNTVMPLIRYDTGDLGKFGKTASGMRAHNLIEDVHGRRLDVLVGGTSAHPYRMHPLAVWGPVASLSEIQQFQLRQHDVGKFTWVLIAGPSAELERKLRLILDERIGNIVSCDFQYVSDVPVMASGKRQFFVNEIADPLQFINGRQS